VVDTTLGRRYYGCMIITSRFTGVCKTCHGPIAVGQKIEWTRGEGSAHAVAAECVIKVTPVAVVAPVKADASTVAAFLRAAKDRGLKAPKVRFLGPANRELTLSVATERSKNPGAVYVKLGGDYMGSIATDGIVRGTLTNRRDLLDTLTTIAENPAAAAKAYGALHCRCSFCGKELTDAGSVEVGYGPICADHYGLPHTAKGSPALKAVRTLTATERQTAQWAADAATEDARQALMPEAEETVYDLDETLAAFTMAAF